MSEPGCVAGPGHVTGPGHSRPRPLGKSAGLDLSETADRVAPRLLGATIMHGSVGVRLTEVEAYLGIDDPASHAARGPTPRSSVMFGPPGHMYVYLSYGIHRCVNVVCSPDGTASAVLLRAGQVVCGVDEVRSRRGTVPARRLASGPGNLGSALGADLTDWGAALTVCAMGSPIEPATEDLVNDPPHPDGHDRLSADQSTPDGVTHHDYPPRWRLIPAREPVRYRTGPRVGISRNADAPLRFWIDGDPTVSGRR